MTKVILGALVIVIVVAGYAVGLLCWAIEQWFTEDER